MLILAGVSINAVVGDNGVLTRAKEASIANKKASILEAIDLEIASYNIDTILNNPEETSAMLSNLMSKGLIDTVLSSSGPTTDTSAVLGIPQFDDANNYTGYIDYAVTKEDYSILLSVDGSGIYKASFGEVNVSSGGSVAAGTTVVTSNAFNSGSGTEKPEDKGKFTIDNDASVMFVDEINGELSILVKSGIHAKVNIFKNMTLTNSGIGRSAIDIEPGGTLDLYLADGVVLTVDSGYGGISAPASSWNFKYSEGVIGGNGAFAGIHVPKYEEETTINRVELNDDGSIKRDNDGNAIFTSRTYPNGSATLNISGTGSLIAKGGDAGDGGNGGRNNLDWAAGAGGGAGAGIGGNGGNGANGTNAPHGGEKGEDAGNINISGTVKVFAYGRKWRFWWWCDNELKSYY